MGQSLGKLCAQSLVRYASQQDDVMAAQAFQQLAIKLRRPPLLLITATRRHHDPALSQLSLRQIKVAGGPPEVLLRQASRQSAEPSGLRARSDRKELLRSRRYVLRHDP